MSSLDGIINKIQPCDAMDKNLYDLPPEEEAEISKVAGSLDEALTVLNEYRELLTRGGVFTDEVIDTYIELHKEEMDCVCMTSHPVEFKLYYSV